MPLQALLEQEQGLIKSAVCVQVPSLVLGGPHLSGTPPWLMDLH
jgi:hypothetical protein